MLEPLTSPDPEITKVAREKWPDESLRAYQKVGREQLFKRKPDSHPIFLLWFSGEGTTTTEMGGDYQMASITEVPFSPDDEEKEQTLFGFGYSIAPSMVHAITLCSEIWVTTSNSPKVKIMPKDDPKRQSALLVTTVSGDGRSLSTIIRIDEKVTDRYAVLNEYDTDNTPPKSEILTVFRGWQDGLTDYTKNKLNELPPTELERIKTAFYGGKKEEALAMMQKIIGF